MNKATEHVIRGSKAAFALLVTVVIAVPAGFASIHKDLYFGGSERSAEDSRRLNQLSPNRPPTTESRDNIAPDAKPFSSQYPCIVLPLILKTDNSEDRDRTHHATGREIDLPSVYEKDQSCVLTSPSLISSRLGRQLTLVGAKPSGTS